MRIHHLTLAAISALGLILPAAATSQDAWTFRAQTNLIRQPEAVAELIPAQAAGQALRVSCSALDGPRAVIALGFKDMFASGPRSGGETPSVSVALTSATQEAMTIDTTLDQTETLRWTYVATGAQALRAARFWAANPQVTVTTPALSAAFAGTNAADAIGRVLEACPFKG